jgi:hypothetical protein
MQTTDKVKKVYSKYTHPSIAVANEQTLDSSSPFSLSMPCSSSDEKEENGSLSTAA